MSEPQTDEAPRVLTNADLRRIETALRTIEQSVAALIERVAKLEAPKGKRW